jgi:hypothetical protein
LKLAFCSEIFLTSLRPYFGTFKFSWFFWPWSLIWKFFQVLQAILIVPSLSGLNKYFHILFKFHGSSIQSIRIFSKLLRLHSLFKVLKPHFS